MKAREIWDLYPKLYHVATQDAWPSILEHGLLSTTALLDLFEVPQEYRRKIEETNRRESLAVTHPKYGTVWIRDQKPMTDSALGRCLSGLSLPQWYKLLNSQVFFWPTEARLHTFLNARPYRSHEHCVLTIDTKSLVNAHGDQVSISPINSGSTFYNPRPRGATTFTPLTEFDLDAAARSKGSARAIAELTIRYAVGDIADHVLIVERRRGDSVSKVLWRARR